MGLGVNDGKSFGEYPEGHELIHLMSCVLGVDGSLQETSESSLSLAASSRFWQEGLVETTVHVQYVREY
jgi:hypothetical protein